MGWQVVNVGDVTIGARSRREDKKEKRKRKKSGCRQGIYLIGSTRIVSSVCSACGMQVCSSADILCAMFVTRSCIQRQLDRMAQTTKMCTIILPVEELTGVHAVSGSIRLALCVCVGGRVSRFVLQHPQRYMGEYLRVGVFFSMVAQDHGWKEGRRVNYPLFFLSLSSLFFFVVKELCYFEVAYFVCSWSASVCLCGGRRECEKARVSEWEGCLSTMQARSLTFGIMVIIKPCNVGHLVYFTSELSSLSL